MVDARKRYPERLTIGLPPDVSAAIARGSGVRGRDRRECRA